MIFFFHISAQNIDCGYSLEPPRWGGSNKFSQSMILSRNKKNNAYPCKPQFCYIKVGLRGSNLYRYVFVMNRGCQLSPLAAVAETGTAESSYGPHVYSYSVIPWFLHSSCPGSNFNSMEYFHETSNTYLTWWDDGHDHLELKSNNS